MNITKYLDRLGLGTDYEPNIEFLRVLQKSHLLKIPFENLDIHKKRKISLSIDSLFEKIIIQKRGGFCYELNGLFNEFLEELDFNVKIISARVFSDNGYGKEFEHMALVVKIDKNDYLTDVGFGDFSYTPLQIKMNIKIIDKYGTFWFDELDNKYTRISKIENGELVPQYIFTTKKRKISEFENMCNYHQTSSKSHFTKNKLITLATEEGRITLSNDKLKITNNNNIKEYIVKKENDFDKQLLKYFDLSIE